jgi:hypothetical protein
MILEDVLQPFDHFGVLFEKFSQFRIPKSKSMVDQKHVTFGWNLGLGSHLETTDFLVVGDFEKLSSIELLVGKFHVEGFDETVGEVGAEHLNSVKMIEAFGFRGKIFDWVDWYGNEGLTGLLHC